MYKTEVTDVFKEEYVIKTVEKEIDIKQCQESIPLNIMTINYRAYKRILYSDSDETLIQARN